MIGYKCVYNSIHIKGLSHLKRNKLLVEVYITLKYILFNFKKKNLRSQLQHVTNFRHYQKPLYFN